VLPEAESAELAAGAGRSPSAPGVRSVILREYIAIGGRLETHVRATELQRLPGRLWNLIIKKE
jgi:hypothetical protein